jgi:hypothetical protein
LTAEAVQVEEEHRHPLARALPGVERVRQLIEEQRPVRQAGQRVVEREVAQLVLDRAAAGDVEQDADHARDAAVGHRAGPTPPRQPADLARGRQDAELGAEVGARHQRPADVPVEGGPVVGRDQGQEGGVGAGEPFPGETDERRHRLRPGDRVGGDVPVPDADPGVVQGRADRRLDAHGRRQGRDDPRAGVRRGAERERRSSGGGLRARRVAPALYPMRSARRQVLLWTRAWKGVIVTHRAGIVAARGGPSPLPRSTPPAGR